MPSSRKSCWSGGNTAILKRGFRLPQLYNAKKHAYQYAHCRHSTDFHTYGIATDGFNTCTNTDSNSVYVNLHYFTDALSNPNENTNTSLDTVSRGGRSPGK